MPDRTMTIAVLTGTCASGDHQRRSRLSSAPKAQARHSRIYPRIDFTGHPAKGYVYVAPGERSAAGYTPGSSAAAGGI